MHWLTADSALWALTLAAEAFLTVVILKRKMSRSYPILLTYLIFNLIEDPLAWAAVQGIRGCRLPSILFYCYCPRLSVAVLAGCGDWPERLRTIQAIASIPALADRHSCNPHLHYSCGCLLAQPSTEWAEHIYPVVCHGYSRAGGAEVAPFRCVGGFCTTSRHWVEKPRATACVRPCLLWCRLSFGSAFDQSHQRPEPALL